MADTTDTATIDLSQPTLDVGDYGSESTQDGLMSVVMMVLNIMINNPGTIPEYPHIGVGLGDSRHYINDGKKVLELQTEANKQLLEVFPDINIKVSFSTKTDNNNVQYVEVVIHLPDISQSITATFTSLSDISIKAASYTAKDYTVG